MYDLIIIGGGPAGLAAGIYAVRFGLDTLILEKSEISGQISMSDIVENYPGFPSISGLELMEKYKAHAQEAGVKTKITEVLSVRTEGTRKIVSTDSGDLEAKALIIATGANPKHLGVPGEEEFISKGVSYCAICDGPFFKNKIVVVVGGGNSAVTDALLLSKVAQKVYLVHRRDRLKAAKVLQDRALATPNIEFILNTLVQEIAGSQEGVKKVEKVILQDLNTKESRELSTNGVFIYVGIRPNTEFVNVEKNNEGFIMTDRWMETSEKGIYAAGDCHDTPIWQLVAAVRDGAIAATAANEYIESLK
ncbi:Thioredoxin reductase [Methanosarcina siciliae C2J]|uniref:Thioredoxin reductase n=1 Tax=Methanosarcina siciliae C2J TaxID=1434118 RepID=A0A0E3PL20_9EURY|nr:thioredoxin-disulfide reductase [Methanosarcina siciliae]AKB35964.1 Thioredoxin reductase [Methanosarcina siciliae C2J]